MPNKQRRIPTAKNGALQPHNEIHDEKGTVANKKPKLPAMPATPISPTNSFPLNHRLKIKTKLTQIVASPNPTNNLAKRRINSFGAKL